MQIVAISIGDGAGITLLSEDGSTWRFNSWHRNSVEVNDMMPSAEERERPFASIEDAVKYFRERYGDTLTKVS